MQEKTRSEAGVFLASVSIIVSLPILMYDINKCEQKQGKKSQVQHIRTKRIQTILLPSNYTLQLKNVIPYSKTTHIHMFCLTIILYHIYIITCILFSEAMLIGSWTLVSQTLSALLQDIPCTCF